MQASAQPPPVGGPVILDLYADWCEPCKKLTPKLEKMVTAAKGAVRLAKVNVDTVPELAQALQVQSLPTVMLVHKGKLVDQFKGLPPDSQLQQFVQKAVDLGGGAAAPEKSLETAAALLAEGDVPGATAAYAALSQLPEMAASAKAGIALCALRDDPPNLALAQDMVAELHKTHPADLNKPDVRKAISAIKLAADAPDSSEVSSVSELQLKLETSPLDHESRYLLAQALLREQDTEGAVGELLQIIKKDKAFALPTAEGGSKSAREFLLQIFDSLGNDDKITQKGRRRLANILLM